MRLHTTIVIVLSFAAVAFSQSREANDYPALRKLLAKLQAEVKALQTDNEKLKSENAQLKSELDALKAEVAKRDAAAQGAIANAGADSTFVKRYERWFESNGGLFKPERQKQSMDEARSIDAAIGDYVTENKIPSDRVKALFEGTIVPGMTEAEVRLITGHMHERSRTAKTRSLTVNMRFPPVNAPLYYVELEDGVVTRVSHVHGS